MRARSKRRLRELVLGIAAAAGLITFAGLDAVVIHQLITVLSYQREVACGQ